MSELPVRARLSIALLACNEAANIRRTLESVVWADEIVLLDSGSTDATVAIAEELGARVIYEPWKGYGPQMNSAIDKCTSPWVFSLDADEVLTPELQAEIKQLLAGVPKLIKLPFDKALYAVATDKFGATVPP